VAIAYAITDCDYRREPMTDYLAEKFPALAGSPGKLPLADLPTPVAEGRVELDGRINRIFVKHDDRTSSFYGGNKLRKLEYLLFRARARRAHRVATFGAAASNHMLATALYAGRLGMPCICLTSHQPKTPYVQRTLRLLLANGAEIVRYGGGYHSRIETMRRHVRGRNAWVIPLGGSSWLGTVGYVNAGLELATQVASGELAHPDRIYIATGTMATSAGLALGLALAGLDTSVQAVRVSPDFIMNRTRLERLMYKTSAMLSRIDASIPADAAGRANIEVRHEFFGAGYGVSNEVTDAAVALAKDQLGLRLEPTYTGKAMAALLHDIRCAEHAGKSLLFWNTYNSNPLPEADDVDLDRLPAEFLRYFD
jgi:D-cysteine desulfhydrase